MGSIGCILQKNSDATSWHELLHQFGPFCTQFCNEPKLSQMHPNCTNTLNHEVRVQWVDRVRSLRKIPTRLHGMNFCTTLARFQPSFVRQPNGTKCTQIVRNAPKHEFWSQRGQSGVFVAKNYDAISWNALLHQFGPFCTEFCKAAKRSQMHPNSTRHTKI